MSMWFGEPWPSAKLRAPVCEDDALRVDTPVGEDCLLCSGPILADDRGILTAARRPPSMTGPIHLDCLLGSIGVVSMVRPE